MERMESFRGVVRGLKPLLLMIVTQIILAGMNIFSKLALNDGMHFSILICFRFFFAAAFMLPLSFFAERKKRTKLTKSVLIQAFLCGLFGGSLGQNMYLQSMVYTTVTFASAMFNLIPAVTFIVAIILRLERLCWKSIAGKAKLMGTIICIGGAMVLTLYEGPEIHIGKTNINLLSSTHRHKGESRPILGALLAASGCTCYALMLIVQAKAAQQYPYPYSFTALIAVMASVQSTVVALAMERDWNQWKLGWNIRLLASSYSGIFGSGIMLTLIHWVVHLKGPVYVSNFNPLMLVMVAIAGYLFLEEKLYWGTVIGAIVIVCGLYAVLWGKDKEIKKPLQLIPDSSSEHEVAKKVEIEIQSISDGNKKEAREGK